jgi:hypothetical protein
MPQGRRPGVRQSGWSEKMSHSNWALIDERLLPSRIWKGGAGCWMAHSLGLERDPGPPGTY